MKKNLPILFIIVSFILNHIFLNNKNGYCFAWAILISLILLLIVIIKIEIENSKKYEEYLQSNTFYWEIVPWDLLLLLVTFYITYMIFIRNYFDLFTSEDKIHITIRSLILTSLILLFLARFLQYMLMSSYNDFKIVFKFYHCVYIALVGGSIIYFLGDKELIPTILISGVYAIFKWQNSEERISALLYLRGKESLVVQVPRKVARKWKFYNNLGVLGTASFVVINMCISYLSRWFFPQVFSEEKNSIQSLLRDFLYKPSYTNDFYIIRSALVVLFTFLLFGYLLWRYKLYPRNITKAD